VPDEWSGKMQKEGIFSSKAMCFSTGGNLIYLEKHSFSSEEK
jgi:hypothetical protein